MNLDEDKIIGADEISQYLGISRRQFFYKKEQFENTDYRAPVFIQTIGKPPNRKKIMWTTKTLIELWWLKVHDM